MAVDPKIAQVDLNLVVQYRIAMHANKKYLCWLMQRLSKPPILIAHQIFLLHSILDLLEHKIKSWWWVCEVILILMTCRGSWRAIFPMTSSGTAPAI